MNTGLSVADTAQIKHVLQKYPKIKKVVLFGSRAMGNFKTGSDVDLALFGDVDLRTLSRVKSDLEETLSIPYFFDVINYSDTENQALRKHIDDFGVVFYP